MRNKLLFIFCLALLASCSDNTNTAGGVTEGGNTTGIAIGTIYDSSGAIVSNAVVRIRKQNYVQAPALLRSSSLDTTTDSLGNFKAILDTGHYSIEVIGDNNYVAWKTITVADTLNNIQIAADTLRAPAKLTGYLSRALMDSIPFRWLQVIGLERLIAIDSSTGAFSLDDLPQGSVTLRLIKADGTNALLLTDIELESGESISLGELRDDDFDDDSLEVESDTSEDD